MRRRKLTIMLLALALAVVAATPAAAGDREDPVVQDSYLGTWFYWDDAHVMLTDVALEEWCGGAQLFTVPSSSWQQDDGLWQSKIVYDGLPVFLYEGTLAEVVDEGCAAVAEGGEIPQPIASGVGFSSATLFDQPEPWLGDQPPFAGMYVTNSVRAVVTYEDGSKAKVDGSAAYAVGDGGAPLDEVFGITVVPIG